jgi:hypothetical protein
MAKRGQLTQAVADKARELLGKEITQVELRLMPYAQYVMLNEQRIDPRKINDEERQILSDWRERGWIDGGAAGMTISKEFWRAIHDILLLAYVDYHNQPDE